MISDKSLLNSTGGTLVLVENATVILEIQEVPMEDI